MYRYKRILVNFNLDEGDANIIKYVSVISQMAKSEKIYFLYTEKQMDIPAGLIKEYPQLTESAADFARDKIRQSIKNIFEKDNKQETTIIVNEGQVLDEILKQVRINGIDLVLYGMSKDQPQSRNMAAKLARKVSCSVLVVPEGAGFNLKNLAVAVDFSEHSADAMNTVLAFAKAARVSKINMIHVYQVPTGYHKTGKSFDEFAEIMKGHAQKQVAEFKSRFDTRGIQIEEHYRLDTKPVEAIAKDVSENDITFLAVGARGRGAGAAVLLGSISEGLIENLNIPVLAVKKKGTSLNILNTLFK